jgi:hypothetical protein
MATVACKLHCIFDHYHWTVSNATPCTCDPTSPTLAIHVRIDPPHAICRVSTDMWAIRCTPADRGCLHRRRGAEFINYINLDPANNWNILHEQCTAARDSTHAMSCGTDRSQHCSYSETCGCQLLSPAMHVDALHGKHQPTPRQLATSDLGAWLLYHDFMSGAP